MPPQWMKQLPGFRVYAALDEASTRVERLKKEVKSLKLEVQGAKAKTDLAQGTLTSVADAMNAADRVVSKARLDRTTTLQGRQYRAAKPFPHIVLDDFLDPGILRSVVEEFAASKREKWHHTDREVERKSSSEEEQGFGPFTRTVIHVLNSGPFLTFLEGLTGIEGLIADPHLRGGGLHEITRGGALGVHADFNFYKRLRVYRRLNLIVYLNDHWQDEWGGHLELWEANGRRPAERIAPIFNRAVIFDTSNSSYHGHPHPLQCPEDRSRQSLALYYYSVDYPYEQDRAPHTTVFIQTPAHDHDH